MANNVSNYESEALAVTSWDAFVWMSYVTSCIFTLCFKLSRVRKTYIFCAYSTQCKAYLNQITPKFRPNCQLTEPFFSL